MSEHTTREAFYASDLDGDALEMELADDRAQRAYEAFLAVLCKPSGAMYLDRHQAERLRDYLIEVLT